MIFDRIGKLRMREKAGLAAAGLCVLLFVADRAVVRPVVRRWRRLDVGIESRMKRLRWNLGVLEKEPGIAAECGRLRGALQTSRSTAETIDAIKGEIHEMLVRAGVRASRGGSTLRRGQRPR